MPARRIVGTVASNTNLMVTVQTEDREVALRWLREPGPTGLEGVVAKRGDETYRAGCAMNRHVKRWNLRRQTSNAPLRKVKGKIDSNTGCTHV